LYLQGWALTRAGRAKEGQALTDLAHWLPLGSQFQRALFAEELTKRDQLDAARRERDLVLRVGWYRMWYVGNVLNYVARDAVARKDYARAAAFYERGVVGCLRVGSQFVDASAYLIVPQLVHQYRARAHLAAGKVGEALAEAKVCLDLVPGNIDLAVQLVPELDKAGRKADGDALYEKAAAVHKALCTDYPKGAFAHNSVAWLAACCRRDLDVALEHAKKATDLAPQTAGYLDTLAEVYFQRGDTAKAIECMKKCRTMDPHKAYFTKQLKRFEAGDRMVPPPDEGDDD
jgi:tetratricopeptide (TPR) repeat protein